jgi:hypothetical protein
MSRTFFIISVASLIALSGIVAFWSTLPSRFIGGPISGAGVMEIPTQPTACDIQAHEAVSGRANSEGDNLPSPGICREDWASDWDVPVYNCKLLFGPA